MSSMRSLIAAAALALAGFFALALPAAATETSLAVQAMDVNGLDISLTAANSGGSYFVNASDSRTFLLCQNTNAATRQVTIVAQRASVLVPGYGALAISSQVSVVPATTGLTLIGPFPAAIYDDDSGLAHVTFNAVANLSCGVVRLPGAAG